MAQFVEVPINRLDGATLQALLAEFASRDGTDYGEREFSQEEKIKQLREQLASGQISIVYDADSEEWDLLGRDTVQSFLTE